MNTDNDARKRRAALVHRVQELVLSAAVEVFGAQRSEEPIEGFRILTRTVLDDPTAAVQAAGLVAAIAARKRIEFAEQGRAAGLSWDEIGEALDVSEDGARGRGESTFEWLIEGRAPEPPGPEGLYGVPMTWWRCGTCDAQISDRGPFESHPDDNETGHTPDCTRHQAALTAHRRQIEEDEL